ncbi:hypothetical protein B0H13DRAFT_2122278 [Mycena leptocephala]|nr:hypothetical protein B0H13DRAFT_2122278 [Mycena leptocephala]
MHRTWRICSLSAMCLNQLVSPNWTSISPSFHMNPLVFISASIQDCFAVIIIFTDLKLTVPQTQAFPRVLLKSPKLLIRLFFRRRIAESVVSMAWVALPRIVDQTVPTYLQ